jgi:hypothetical protein
MKDPKSIAIMLLGKKKAAEEPEPDDGEEPSMPPLEDVMQEFLDATKAGDTKAMAKAFRGAMACAEDYSDDEEE